MNKTDKQYWEEFLKRYRLSKKVKKLRDKFGLSEIGNMTGQSRQYIYAIQEMTIKPSEEFKKRIGEL